MHFQEEMASWGAAKGAWNFSICYHHYGLKVCCMLVFEGNVNFYPKADEEKRRNFYPIQVLISECDMETESLPSAPLLPAIRGRTQKAELRKQRQQLVRKRKSPGLC